MTVSLRPFQREDIPLKVRWINDPRNNRFLHYDLPLEQEKTERWFDAVKDRTDRYDAIILADGCPCGTIGLLGIDRKNQQAEYYIAMGVQAFKGKGVASEASRQLLAYAFCTLKLNRVYLKTETENLPAQRLFERLGFVREGCLRADVISRGGFADRYIYSVLRCEFLEREHLV